jgi:hypothetical protein
VARAMQGLVDKLNRIGVRMEELEERQDCLEDAVNPKIASNVSPSAPPNVSLEVAPNASPGVADAPAAADGPTLPDDSALPKDR